MKPRDITPEDEYDDELYDPLIYPTPRTSDDRCDHTAQLIWHMRQRATIRSGAAWTPCPRPVPSDPAQRRRAPTRLNIGLRRSYSSTIVTAVYQLHLRHAAAHEIAALLGIPPKKVELLLQHKTQTQRRAWQQVHQSNRLPGKREILAQLARGLPG
ncbi:hypothetical protein [Edwardsiella piscicida]|uniref:hypothetical protein n=1 Tax=Edwardsiella piscicida TaxID=1263550 RepID=UPI002A6680C0|nr:hypothetical protein [Edwardsiella piscicida]